MLDNARLYNEVQDLRGAIRVFCRVRPAGATGDGSPPCVEVGVDGEVCGRQTACCCSVCGFVIDRSDQLQAAAIYDPRPAVR